MACRLAFDMGLNLDCSTLGLSTQEEHIRHMVLWACVVHDQSWALFLGRPTTIKSSDVAMPRFPDISQPATTKSLKSQIYEALRGLMDLAAKTLDEIGGHQAMASLDRELHFWFQSLPLRLRWTPENVKDAPFSFFILQ